MTTLERNYIAANLLRAVLDGGAYSTLELNHELKSIADERDKAYISRLFYGVLAKSVQLDYVLDKLVTKRPKPVVALCIKMGFYMLRYMDEPDYAVISTQVELVKKLGKRELSGFVNAVLRRSGEVELPKNGDKATVLSVNCSCPLWVVKRLIKQWGVQKTEQYLSAEISEKTHIRVNTLKITPESFEKMLPAVTKSVSGYYVTRADVKSISDELYTVQSLSSVLATEYYACGVREGATVLDLCAAPGGKSVYIATLKNAQVTACDLHENRTLLIKNYAARMGVRLNVMQNDATVVNDKLGEYDCVICDVPCSGIGVMFSKPDILFNRKEEDIAALSKTQYEIITAAAKYVKKGGQLNYSTCTVIEEENEKIVNRFLSENPDFTLVKCAADNVACDADGFVRIYPHTHGCDGFFVAKLRRKA